ncbi:MAG TPA: hypothetical protein VGH28_20345 [Polyangiaceae bacterium]
MLGTGFTRAGLPSRAPGRERGIKMSVSGDQAKLRRGDWLVRGGEIEKGVRLYAEVARSFRRQGLALAAVAVWTQVRDLLRRETSTALAAEARTELIALYRELGLEGDASALEMEARSELH